MIRIVSLDKAKLLDFIHSEEYKKYDFLPITEHRAISHTKNPRADENDTLLSLAFEGDQLAGYLGTFPDELFFGEKKIKFAWLSTLYVSEKFRGRRIAQLLLDHVFEKYKNKIAITEFTKEAESLYNKTKKFSYGNPKNGKRFYFRFDTATFLPAKNEKYKTLKPVLNAADLTLNFGLDVRKIFSSRKNIFTVKILDVIDEEADNFIKNFPKNSSNRQTNDLNWILQNPWILEQNTIEKNYLFSSYSKEFKFFVVKIFNGKNISDLAILQLRDGHLKIPYLFSKNISQHFILFLSHFIREKKVKMLTSYQTDLNRLINNYNAFPKLYQKDFVRRYFFSNDMLSELPENFIFNFQDGDGDCVFT